MSQKEPHALGREFHGEAHKAGTSNQCAQQPHKEEELDLTTEYMGNAIGP